MVLAVSFRVLKLAVPPTVSVPLSAMAPELVAANVLPGLTLATNPVLRVPATGIGSLTIRLTLAADTAQAYRSKASPIRFRVEIWSAEKRSRAK